MFLKNNSRTYVKMLFLVSVENQTSCDLTSLANVLSYHYLLVYNVTHFLFRAGWVPGVSLEGIEGFSLFPGWETLAGF